MITNDKLVKTEYKKNCTIQVYQKADVISAFYGIVILKDGREAYVTDLCVNETAAYKDAEENAI